MQRSQSYCVCRTCAVALLLVIAAESANQALAQPKEERQQADILAPITLKADAPTDAARRRGRLELLLHDVTLYRLYTSDPEPARKPAEEFLTIVIHRAAEQRDSESPEAARWRELPALGKQLVETLGSKDPLVLASYSEILLRQNKADEARRVADEAAAALEQAKYPPGWKLPLLMKRAIVVARLGTPRDRDLANSEVARAIVPWLNELRTLPNWHRPAWRTARDAFGFLPDTHEISQAIVSEYEALPEKDAWLLAMLRGWNHDRLGWRHRGGGYANKVTGDGWQKFQEHQTQAAVFFREAYKLHPEFPEAAAEMIGVAMAGYDEDNERVWFDRAIAAQCDFFPAYRAVLWSLRPRWGGSHAAMLKFGEQCVRTKRFDTEVPHVYINAVLDIVGEVTWEPVLASDPKLFSKAEHVLTKMADDPGRKGIGGKLSLDQTRLLTYLAGFAVRADRFDKAKPLLEKLGDDMDREWLLPFNVYKDYDLSRIYAYTEFEAELLASRETTKSPRNNPDRTRRALEDSKELLSKSKDPRSKLYLQTWVDRLQMEHDYFEGKTVELKFDERMLHWAGMPNFKAEDEHTVLAENVNAAGDIATYSVCEFHGPKEVSVEIEYLRVASNQVRAGIYFGTVHRFPEFERDGRTFWIDAQGGFAGYADATENLGAVKLNFKPTQLFVKVWGPQRFEYYINGRRYGQTTSDETFLASSAKIGIGTPPQYSMRAELRFRNVRVRMLNEAEPPAETESAAERIEYYTAALKHEPAIWDHYLQRGAAFEQNREWAKAIADFEQGVKEMPESRLARMRLGSALCQTGKYAEGLKILDAVHAEARSQPSDLSHATLAANLATIPDDTLRDGKRALEIARDTVKHANEPNYVKLYSLAVALGATGEFNEALATAKQLESLAATEEQKQQAAQLSESFADSKPWRLTPASSEGKGEKK